MSPLSLLDWRPPSVSGSATSEAAAEAIAPTAGTLRARVLDVLRAHPGGLTDEQLVELTGLSPSTVRPRRVELIRAGLVCDTGDTRPGKSGRAMTIWRVR